MLVDDRAGLRAQPLSCAADRMSAVVDTLTLTAEEASAAMERGVAPASRPVMRRQMKRKRMMKHHRRMRHHM